MKTKIRKKYSLNPKFECAIQTLRISFRVTNIDYIDSRRVPIKAKTQFTPLQNYKLLKSKPSPVSHQLLPHGEYDYCKQEHYLISFQCNSK